MTYKIGVLGDVRRHNDNGMLLGDMLADKVNATVVSFDDGMMGHTKHQIKVWTNLLQYGGADWLVVLEDDAVPVEGFREQLDLALADPPADIVSLYLGTGYPKAWQRFVKTALREPSDWVLSTHLLHSVGAAIRLDLVNDMLGMVSWMSQEQRLWPFDEQVTHWARQRGHQVAYTRPSLVDHLDGPSLIAHPDGEARTAKRVAHEVGTSAHFNKSSVVTMP